MNATPGNRLGKYELQAELGRGGMGIVYRGYDTALRRPVAIKILPPQLAFDADFVRRFQQEAILAASLRHPNIVTIHDVGEQAGVYYIVMEFLEGTTLEHWLDRHGSLTPTQAAQVVRQVAGALDYAHAHGVIHRDVKPANIMIGPDGRATLMDFGLVRAAEGTHLTRSGTIMGTPEYMSPEQALGQPLDGRSDVYSLGIVLYKMLAGKPPFSGTSPLGITHAHVYDPPPPLRQTRPDLPTSLEVVIAQALAKRPEERFSRAGLLAEAFTIAIEGGDSAAITGSTVPGALSPGPASRPPRTTERPLPRGIPWLAAGLGFLAVVGIGFGLFFATLDHNARPPAAGASLQIATPTARTARAAPTTQDDITRASPIISSPTTAPTRETPITSPTQIRLTETPLRTPPVVASPTLIAPTVVPMVRGSSGPVNTRSGPGTAYPVIGQISAGETYQIIGRNADTSWWQICCVDGKPAWVAAEVVEASQVRPGIPVIAASPPPIPIPTARPLTCAANAGPTFARAWDRSRLGCPRGPEAAIWSAYEVFERGWMLWRQDNDGHYAFFSDGAYIGYWYPAGEPPDFACGQAQALGRPRRGFSRVWCENLSVRQRIGNAVNDEVGDNRPVQEFDNGFMVYVRERGTIITAFKDNTWNEQR